MTEQLTRSPLQKRMTFFFSSHRDYCIMGSNSLQWDRGHWLGKGSGPLGITRSAQEHFEEILQEISEMLEGSKSGLFATEGWVCISRWVPCLMKDQFQLKGPDLFFPPFPPQPVLSCLSTILFIIFSTTITLGKFLGQFTISLGKSLKSPCSEKHIIVLIVSSVHYELYHRTKVPHQLQKPNLRFYECSNSFLSLYTASRPN